MVLTNDAKIMKHSYPSTEELQSNCFHAPVGDRGISYITELCHFPQLSSLLPTANNHHSRAQNPSVPVYVFTDADIAERPDEVESALKECSVLFCSLVVDFIQVQWIKER